MSTNVTDQQIASQLYTLLRAGQPQVVVQNRNLVVTYLGQRYQIPIAPRTVEKVQPVRFR